MVKLSDLLIVNFKQDFFVENKRYVLTIGTISAILVGVFTKYYYFNNKRKYVTKIGRIIESVSDFKRFVKIYIHYFYI